MFLFPIISFAGTKEEWIEDLHRCENRFKVEKILDSNNKYSYGDLMFQLDTFYSFGQKYGILPSEMSKWEAKLLISNPSIQRAVAREMLDDGLQRHWLNCVKKIGNYPVRSG